MFLQISEKLQKNTCARVSFLKKFHTKEPWYRCCSVNFATFLGTPFLQNTYTGCFHCQVSNCILCRLIDSGNKCTQEKKCTREKKCTKEKNVLKKKNVVTKRNVLKKRNLLKKTKELKKKNVIKKRNELKKRNILKKEMSQRTEMN